MQKITKEHVVRTFNAAHTPAARVQSGEVFTMETNDRFRDWNDGASWPMDQITVMTGPVFVEEAKPGQVLKVDILDIRPTQGFGYVVAIPKFGVFKDQLTEFRKMVVPIEGNQIRFNERITLPYKPMVGKIGLAPQGDPLPSNASGPFGGQMTNLELGPGATVYLPVFVDGGLLTVEDVHAAMGDGEAAGSAVEMASEVTLRCEAAKEIRLTNPLVLTQTEAMTSGRGETLEAATKMALEDLAALLMERAGVDFTEAAMLVSVAADVRLSYVGGAPYLVRAAVPREIMAL
jgi:amidase